MDPAQIEPAREALKMRDEMERGLAGEKSSLPMIPTYLSDVGEIPLHEPVAVIDAGGVRYAVNLESEAVTRSMVKSLRDVMSPGE